MKKIKLVLGIIIGIFIFAIVCPIVFIPIFNDNIAKKTAQNVKEIALPPDTEYVETFAKAGKLVGNGNGMQYLGGILIKSDLSLQELQSYYSQYTKSENEFIVEKQTDKNIPFIEHGTVSFHADINNESYYIIYSWGNSNSVFSELDLRGH